VNENTSYAQALARHVKAALLQRSIPTDGGVAVSGILPQCQGRRLDDQLQGCWPLCPG
jgi:hypothetical protein